MTAIVMTCRRSRRREPLWACERGFVIMHRLTDGGIRSGSDAGRRGGAVLVVPRLHRPVQPERLREEYRHLPARQRRVRAEVAVAAPRRDARRGERLDELEE